MVANMKKRNVIKLIYELIKLIGPFFSVIFLAALLGTIGYILAMNITLFGAIAILKFLNIPISLDYVWIFLIIIASSLLRGVVRYFEQYFNHYIAFNLLAIIRGKLFNKLRELCPAKLESKNKGEIISLIQSDIETLEVFYAHTISPFLIAILTSTTVFLFLGFFSSWIFASIALLSYIIIGAIIPLIYYKINNKFGKKYRKELGVFNEFYLDSIYGYFEILSSNNQSVRLNKVSKMSSDLINLNDSLDKKSALFKNISNSIIIIMNICIIIVGAYLAKNSIINSPMIILGYVTLTSSFGSVLALAELPRNLAMTFASGNRVLNLLEEKPLIKDTSNSFPFVFESLKVNNISFKYDSKLVIKNFSMKVNKNEILGILGPSGCGKSTLLKLLMRFYDVDQGEILYNNKNIKETSIKDLYKNVNLFSQSTYLFYGTIKENLLIANPDATEQELIEACKNASVYQYIKKLPHGFDTKINELKDNLSTGEKQRIGLARVFLRKPKLLLLDEATSNIDAINESIILNALKLYKKDMTIIIISHRKSTLSICDRIYELS